MASLYVSFVKVGAFVNGGSIPVSDGESCVSETVTTSASNAQSAAGTLPFVRVVSDVAHFIAIGSNPNAETATTRFYLPANTVEYFQIEIGNKVAGITA